MDQHEFQEQQRNVTERQRELEKRQRVTHTPGPWRIGMRNGANSNLVYAHNGVDQYHDDAICSVYGMYQHAEISAQKENSGLANARLIAAAPDLLDALKKIMAVTIFRADDLTGEQVEAWTKARTAIAKATGGAA